jgi:spore coat protein A
LKKRAAILSGIAVFFAPSRKFKVEKIMMRFLAFLFLISISGPAAFAFEPFVDALPIPPVLHAPKGKHPVLKIKMQEFSSKIHRDLGPVKQFGYAGISPGPTIEVEAGSPLQVQWQNELPGKHVLAAPSDMMADGPDVKAVVHLHGAMVTQPSTKDRVHNNDGWPDAWITHGQTQIADYPNEQRARMLWYHDHAMGTTGRNVAAGLLGVYFIRDAYERSLNLPSGAYEIPLVIQPKLLNGDGSLAYVESLAVEHYGNAMFVNGKLYPYLEVEPRKYRFRVLNASNARTVALKLVDGEDLETAGPGFYQIGSDSGFLENTVLLNDPASEKSSRLTLAPAERADIIVDFSKYAGKTFVLHNNALPDDADGTVPLYQVMQFRVKPQASAPDTSSLPMKMQPIRRMEVREAANTRRIVFDQMEMGGQTMLTLNGKMWHDPVSEMPVLGSTEVWELVDTLPDSHPFHIHLVDFQVLDRRPFDLNEYLKSGKIEYSGAAEAPDANEMGWKDTVRITPAHVTRIIMKFAPFAGHYVYHCHILEHEDMDMMRPFDVVPAKK